MKYGVYRTHSVWDYHIIEAENRKHAREIAFDLPIMEHNYIDDSTIICDDDITELDNEHTNSGL